MLDDGWVWDVVCVGDADAGDEELVVDDDCEVWDRDVWDCDVWDEELEEVCPVEAALDELDAWAADEEPELGPMIVWIMLVTMVVNWPD